MNTPKNLPLSGVYRPRSRAPGFGIPVFADEHGLWVQEIGEDDRVRRFIRCDIDPGALRKATTQEQGVGQLGFYAFELVNGRVIVTTGAKLRDALRATLSELKKTPFVLQDVAEFIGDQHLLAEARAACDLVLPGRKPNRTPTATDASFKGNIRASTEPSVEFFLKCLKLGQSIDEAYADTVKVFGPDAAKATRVTIAKKTGDLYILRDPPIIVEHGMAEWYPGPSDEDEYWPPLKSYLIKKGWLDAIEDLDKASSQVVSRLAPPGLAQIHTRGLVVGYVQSGKTANFTAVISKAADVNYRMFVVLSGLTNSLRNQTQVRLEAELRDLNPSKWLTLTQGDRDFNGRMPVNVDYALSPGPRILVVLKKNPFVLRRFFAWLSGGNPTLMQNCPMLVIDDEADQASVNTSRNEQRRTVINRLILELLRCAPKSAYVGYTATPFANVLNEPPLGDNLYPRHFILSLPRPRNYFGPERIFGRERLRTEEDDSEIDGLDVIRPVPDDDALRLRTGLDAFRPAIVPSLEFALRYFWMATAARLARKPQIDFSTMLVHTTLRTDMHETYRQEMVLFHQQFQTRLKNDPAPLRAQLEAQWIDETARLDRTKAGCVLPPVQFAELWPLFEQVVSNTRIVVDNHRSMDRLDFSDARRGTIYLVIGGNTLSRGLTLEGLIVSYFIRTSTAYDTLMQMGRWFGYRKDYEDLPRIWMTDELIENFFDLATVEEDFRSEVKRYTLQKTPAQFGPRIRTHPSLSITSRLKMQAAVLCAISYGGERPQTILFKHLDKEWLGANLKATRDLLERASALPGVTLTKAEPSRVALHDVPANTVLDFFTAYRFHERNRELSAELVAKYIAAQNKQGTLLKWNVVLLGHPKKPNGAFKTDVGEVGLLVRSRMPSSDPNSANIKALMSRKDIVADLAPDVSHEAMDEESLFALRQKEFPTHGLLVLYPIARDSKPLPTAKQRQPLDAVDDVIGLAMVCPSPDRDTPQGYMTVDMSNVPREELDFDEDAEARDDQQPG